MTIPYEPIVAEDLNLGHGAVSVTMPGGGSAIGSKVGLHTWCGDVYNVRDFGAVGDGVTDDHVAIQAAIAAVPSGGGAVYFAPGTYRIGAALSIANKNDVTLYGPGRGATIVCATNIRAVTVDTAQRLRFTGLRILGNLPSVALVGNLEQGRIDLSNVTDVQIDACHWEDIGGTAVFIRTGNTRVWIHHCELIRTHAGIQTGGGVTVPNDTIWITDNYFLGNTTISGAIGDAGSDDQIATFSGLTGQILIARNIINKQGPTANNIAHGILIDVDGAGLSNALEIQVTDNIILNVKTTNGNQARPAISVISTGAVTLTRISVHNNIVRNCNAGIQISPGVAHTSIIGNKVTQVTTVGGAPGNVIASGIYGFDAPVCSYLIVALNDVDTVDVHGIWFTNVNQLVLNGNLVKSATANGFNLDAVTNLTMIGNQAIGNTARGALLSQITRGTVIGNKFNANGTWGVTVSGNSPSIVLIGNDFNGNGSGTVQDSTGGTPNLRYLENADIGTVGISGTGTAAKNLRGTAVFGGGVSQDVFMAFVEPDANYVIALGPTANKTFWVTNKLANKFTLNASVASTEAVDWILIR